MSINAGLPGCYSHDVSPNASLHLTLPDAPTVMLSSMMQWSVDLRCLTMLQHADWVARGVFMLDGY